MKTRIHITVDIDDATPAAVALALGVNHASDLALVIAEETLGGLFSYVMQPTRVSVDVHKRDVALAAHLERIAR